MQKYQVNQYQIEFLLSSLKASEIVIPEIQRPFVWDSTKVRDLLDSLYKGFPIGYIIIWKNPTVKLKNGNSSEGKKIIIDGQQRITALAAAILGQEIIDKTYKKIRIKIAFNPQTETFEVQNPAIAKDKTWIADISEIMQTSSYNVVNKYKSDNPNCNEEKIVQAITTLIDIPKKQIGVIDLIPELDIDTVTEIFIRINSKGMVLSQADFAMSKISSDNQYGGGEIRKLIDYFCHLSIAPEFFENIKEHDKEFSKTEKFQKISWLKSEKDDLYDPEYDDLLKVAFAVEFDRGKLQDLVSLLSGRNFEKQVFEEEIMEDSFKKLEKGVLNFISETNFKRFLMILRSAGFISPKLLKAQNAINSAYILFLKLRKLNVSDPEIEKYVRKWTVMSILTSRYSNSFESTIDYDIKRISEKGIKDYLLEIEEGELSDAFWNSVIVQGLESSVASSPLFQIFLTSQSKSKDNGFLSSGILVQDLITHRGDIHHIFPKNYLLKNGLNKNLYNQVANYVYMQTEINIKLSDKSPKDYFDRLVSEFGSSKAITGINSNLQLLNNLKENCIPEETLTMEIKDYASFLELRRKLMAQKIKNYYFSL